MSLKPYQEKMIQQFITQERLLSKLYAAFAEKFPSYHEFWKKLSQEEERHARLIEKLSQAEKKGLILFDEGVVKTYTLNAFTHFDSLSGKIKTTLRILSKETTEHVGRVKQMQQKMKSS